MVEAGTLGCPRCGAPASSRSQLCQHCGTALAVVSCPRCLAKVFEGSRHCPRCGARLARLAGGSTKSLLCPRCERGLRKVSLGEVQLAECGECTGTWIDTEGFLELCEDRQAQAAVLGRAAVDAPERYLDEPCRSKRAYSPCPACRELMLPQDFAQSGVVVDICRRHGIWFEGDEIQQILRFVGAGGYAEQSLERERHLLREERRLLAQRLHAGSQEPSATRQEDADELADGLRESRGLLRQLLYRARLPHRVSDDALQKVRGPLEPEAPPDLLAGSLRVTAQMVLRLALMIAGVTLMMTLPTGGDLAHPFLGGAALVVASLLPWRRMLRWLW